VAVFVEGCCVLGLFPFIASFLFELGETSLSIAGLVIAGFAVGGLFYTLTISRFLPALGVKGMMIAGATLVGLQLAVVAFGPGAKAQALSLLLMGWGFYMIHGCLQVFASELSVEARATALSLHSFFFSWARLSARSPMASASSMPARCRPCSLPPSSSSRSDLSAQSCCGRRGRRTRWRDRTLSPDQNAELGFVRIVLLRIGVTCCASAVERMLTTTKKP
jgi:hypothetical protein